MPRGQCTTFDNFTKLLARIVPSMEGGQRLDVYSTAIDLSGPGDSEVVNASPGASAASVKGSPTGEKLDHISAAGLMASLRAQDAGNGTWRFVHGRYETEDEERSEDDALRRHPRSVFRAEWVHFA